MLFRSYISWLSDPAHETLLSEHTHTQLWIHTRSHMQTRMQNVDTRTLTHKIPRTPEHTHTQTYTHSGEEFLLWVGRFEVVFLVSDPEKENQHERRRRDGERKAKIGSHGARGRDGGLGRQASEKYEYFIKPTKTC